MNTCIYIPKSWQCSFTYILVGNFTESCMINLAPKPIGSMTLSESRTFLSRNWHINSYVIHTF